MIVFTEVFICFKHGKGQFSHASFSPLAIFYLSSIGLLLLFIFCKVLISDLINYALHRKEKKEADNKINRTLKDGREKDSNLARNKKDC